MTSMNKLAGQTYFNRLENSAGYDKSSQFSDRSGGQTAFMIAYRARLEAGAGRRAFGRGDRERFVSAVCDEAGVPELAEDLLARLEATRPIAPDTDDSEGVCRQFFEMLVLAPELWAEAGRGGSTGNPEDRGEAILAHLIHSIARGRELAGSAWDPRASVRRKTPLGPVLGASAEQ